MITTKSRTKLLSFCLEKRELHGYLMEAFKYLKWVYKTERNFLSGLAVLGQGAVILNIFQILI